MFISRYDFQYENANPARARDDFASTNRKLSSFIQELQRICGAVVFAWRTLSCNPFVFALRALRSSTRQCSHGDLHHERNVASKRATACIHARRVCLVTSTCVAVPVEPERFLRCPLLSQLDLQLEQHFTFVRFAWGPCAGACREDMFLKRVARCPAWCGPTVPLLQIRHNGVGGWV